mgnify:CR=1 FL=1
MPGLGFARACIAAAFVALGCAPLAAQALTLVTATSSLGNQHDYSGIGFKFHVNSAITISQLGVFDSGADGIAGTTTLWTTLFDSSGNVIVASAFTNSDAGALESFFRYKDIAPTTLGVGDYILAGYGWDASNLEYNSFIVDGLNTTTFNASPLVTFVDTRFGPQNSSIAHTIAPTNVFPDHSFNSVNMHFQSAVPEPATLALWAVGLGFVGLRRRRRA